MMIYTTVRTQPITPKIGRSDNKSRYGMILAHTHTHTHTHTTQQVQTSINSLHIIMYEKHTFIHTQTIRHHTTRYDTIRYDTTKKKNITRTARPQHEYIYTHTHIYIYINKKEEMNHDEGER